MKNKLMGNITRNKELVDAYKPKYSFDNSGTSFDNAHGKWHFYCNTDSLAKAKSIVDLLMRKGTVEQAKYKKYPNGKYRIEFKID